MKKTISYLFLKEALALPSHHFAINHLFHAVSVVFLGAHLSLPLKSADLKVLRDENRISINELSEDASHEKIIETLAYNYKLAQMARSMRYTNFSQFLMGRIRGGAAISELNKQGGAGITLDGVENLYARFKQELFEALVQLLVSKSSDGYSSDDFKRVNKQIAPYGIKLQDFGIKMPKHSPQRGFGISA